MEAKRLETIQNPSTKAFAQTKEGDLFAKTKQIIGLSLAKDKVNKRLRYGIIQQEANA